MALLLPAVVPVFAEEHLALPGELELPLPTWPAFETLLCDQRTAEPGSRRLIVSAPTGGRLFAKAEDSLWIGGIENGSCGFDDPFIPSADAPTPIEAERPDVSDPSEEKPAAHGRDWVGLGRDTALLFGYQVVGVGVLYLLPESVSKWSDNKKDHINASTWWENVRDPKWDKDEWWINFLWHPYFGATYYIRARERGFDEVSSFAVSALWSAMYEFGVEALFEHPSIQDLIFTPVGGALLGAFVFEPIRNRVKAKPELRWHDHLVLVATDPIGALNYVVERLVGIKSEIRVDARPPTRVLDPRSTGGPVAAGDLLHDHGVSFAVRMRWE